MPYCCVTVSMWGSEGGWGVSQSVSPDGDGECSDRGRRSQSFMAYLRGVAVTLYLCACLQNLGDNKVWAIWQPQTLGGLVPNKLPCRSRGNFQWGRKMLSDPLLFSPNWDWIKWKSKFVGLCMCHGREWIRLESLVGVRAIHSTGTRCGTTSFTIFTKEHTALQQ